MKVVLTFSPLAPLMASDALEGEILSHHNTGDASPCTSRREQTENSFPHFVCHPAVVTSMEELTNQP